MEFQSGSSAPSAQQTATVQNHRRLADIPYQEADGHVAAPRVRRNLPCTEENANHTAPTDGEKPSKLDPRSPAFLPPPTLPGGPPPRFNPPPRRTMEATNNLQQSPPAQHDLVAPRTNVTSPPTTTGDASTSEKGSVTVSSLSEALQWYYGHNHTEQQVKYAFRLRAVRQFFAREWAKLQSRALRQHTTSKKLCWYHRNYRTAYHCKRPCRYGMQISLSSDVVRNWPCLEHSTMTGLLIICRPPCPMQPHNVRWNTMRAEPLPQ